MKLPERRVEHPFPIYYVLGTVAIVAAGIGAATTAPEEKPTPVINPYTETSPQLDALKTSEKATCVAKALFSTRDETHEFLSVYFTPAEIENTARVFAYDPKTSTWTSEAKNPHGLLEVDRTIQPDNDTLHIAGIVQEQGEEKIVICTPESIQIQ